jgi:S1-C subfamily serine protease
VAPGSRNSRVSNRSFDGETLYNEVLPSVATLAVDKGDGTGMTGTGFLAYENGIIVTAWHVVDGAHTVVAKFADGDIVECSGLIAKDVQQDIAIIKIEQSSRRLLPIANERPAIGSKAFIVGAPKGREFSFSDGTVSQNESTMINNDGVATRRETIQYNCPTSPGNSGGPLFDANGVVRGIVSFGLTEGQNLNFAIPMSLASKLDRTAEVTPWDQVR